MTERLNLGTPHGVEQFAEIELARYRELMGDLWKEGADKVPTTTTLITWVDPETREPLTEAPKAHQLIYRDGDFSDRDIRRNERHLATALKVSASIHLWHDFANERIVLVVQHADSILAGYQRVQKTPQGVEFGPFTDLAPPSAPSKEPPQ
jgi:hypothetical protein